MATATTPIPKANFTLETPIYNGGVFNWSSNKEGVAEASTLEVRPGVAPHSKCYRDAEDLGLRITSPLTLRVYHFVFREHKIYGGEVSGWIYSCVEEPHLTAVILND